MKELRRSKVVIILILVILALTALSALLYTELLKQKEKNAVSFMLISYGMYDDMYYVGDLIKNNMDDDIWFAIKPFLETNASIAEIIKQVKVSDLSQRIITNIQSYESGVIDDQQFRSEMDKIKQEISFEYLADPYDYFAY